MRQEGLRPGEIDYSSMDAESLFVLLKSLMKIHELAATQNGRIRQELRARGLWGEGDFDE